MKARPNNNSGGAVLEVNRGDEALLMAATTAPFRLKKILVPTDFSDCSRKALQYAIPLANQHGAAITLLNVVPAPTYTAGEYGGIACAPMEADLRASEEKRLAAFARDEVRGKAPVGTFVRIGLPTDEIIELARILPADIIVISTHGHTGLKHLILGSVAEHVVRHAPCPVLVVREREHEFLAT